MKRHRLIQGVCAILAEDLGKAKADRIAEAAQKRYETLCVENAADSKALRAHTYRRIYPAIAVYEIMGAEGVSQDTAIWYIREYFQRFAAKISPHMQRMIKVFGLEKRLPRLFMKLSIKLFPEDAGFRYEFPETHGNEARFNMVRCPYFEACKRYGCPEITAAFCDADDTAYGHMHPKLIWGRTTTLGRGDKCCNFLLEYKK